MSNIIGGGFSSIEQMTNQAAKSGVSKTSNNYTGVSFEEILKQKQSIEEAIDGAGSSSSVLKFSKHAGQRLQQRDIQLTDEQMARLEEGTMKAGSKGIKESLVLLDDMAFIVNTQSNTVITAMDQTTNNENVFTNIDGAVVI